MTDDKEPTKGRARGGEARAAKLSPERRREIAKKAALARHGPKPLNATHKGNFQEDFGIDVDCYVLDDEQKTAVISQRGMGAALKLGEGGRALPRFAEGKTVAEALGGELLEKIANPLIFNGDTLVGNLPPMGPIYGYNVTVLIDVCKALVTAQTRGELRSSQANIAGQAQIILNASAKSGIQGLVYKLAGYDATRAEVVAAFKAFIQEEAREYEREFPPMLYNEWYRLYKIKRPERGRPWKARSLTIDHVYYPLARSSGRIYQLVQAQKAEGSARNKKLHQFLSELGVKALRSQVNQLLGIARISKSEAEYEGHVKTLFGDQPDLPGIGD